MEKLTFGKTSIFEFIYLDSHTFYRVSPSGFLIEPDVGNNFASRLNPVRHWFGPQMSHLKLKKPKKS